MKRHYIIWIVCVSLAILHQIVQYIFGIQISIIDAYLDPLLFYPVVLGALLVERQFWVRPTYVLSRVELLIYFILLTFIVEIIFPYVNERFVFDPYDLIMYFIGIIFFAIFINKPRYKET